MRLPAYRHEQTGNPALDRIQAGLRSIYDFLKAPRFVGSVEQFADQGGGWQDLLGQIDQRSAGATIPTFEAVGGTAFYDHNFAVGDLVYQNYHIPHDYVPGSAVHLHTHWYVEGTNTQAVTWRFTWCYANGYGRGAFGMASPTVVDVSTTPGGVTRTHYISETAAQSAAFETDGILKTIITRVTNGGTNPKVYLSLADAHYRSNGAVTKNRNYPFT